MSARKLLWFINQPVSNGMQRHWMGRPQYFQTASRVLREEEGSGLGKPTGVKKTKGLTKTDWSRPSAAAAGGGGARQEGYKRVLPKRDWNKPVDQHAEKHAGESFKTHERHVNKFSKSEPKRSESLQQKRERKKREEELNALAKEEEKERQMIAIRKAKLKAKEQAESNHMKDVYIPEIINVANLSRILGIRIGKILTHQERKKKIKLTAENFFFLPFLEKLMRTMEELDMGSTSHDRSK